MKPMTLTAEEKRELLNWLGEQEYELLRPVRLSGFPPTEGHKYELNIINAIRSIIESRPEPRTDEKRRDDHTQCENCLDDLEDYTWVYCDDCWQKLCADLKKARPMVTAESFQTAIDRLVYWAGARDGLTEGMAKLMVKTMLQENGIEVELAHVNSKVDEGRGV